VALDAAQRATAARGTEAFALQDAAQAIAREGALPGHGFMLRRARSGEEAP
jgi:hypothetical protein